MISSSDSVTAISMLSKKLPLSSKEQGIPCSAIACAKVAARLPGERIRITISSGRQGRRAPSSPVTGYPPSSSCRMRPAVNRASASSFFTGRSSSADFCRAEIR